MDYEDAARLLVGRLEDAGRDEELAASALEIAGAVHAEALLASLDAYLNAYAEAKAQREAGKAPVKLTDSGVELQPMSDQTIEIRLDFPLTASQFAVLQDGTAPVDEFNRWFLDCDGRHLRYYRNATGYCFFDALVEEVEDGLSVGKVVVNQDETQYSEKNPGVCAAQLKILLANSLGLDDDPYWDELDAADDSEM